MILEWIEYYIKYQDEYQRKISLNNMIVLTEQIDDCVPEGVSCYGAIR